MQIRLAQEADQNAVVSIVAPVLQAGETYAMPRDFTVEQARNYWFSPAHQVFVAQENGDVLGTYYLKPNQLGPGAHVANCGYMTAPAAQGKGVARAMCQHSLESARTRGFRAMQFNHVVSTNERAVRLWQSLGFAIVGTLPNAFNHPVHGFVDSYVMFREL
jgi:ribosomal protein S18 acetylase RimI-like enzyme